MSNNDLTSRLARCDAVIFDCDGVLTDGGLYYDQDGNRSLRFHARDGVGLAMFCKKAGLGAGVLSGRPADVARRRFAELGVKAFVGPCHDKFAGARSVCDQLGVSPERCAFVGDDLPDLGGFRAVGVKVAVADAAPEMLEAADLILRTAGGHGAAREICETILKARGLWQELVASAYL